MVYSHSTGPEPVLVLGTWPGSIGSNGMFILAETDAYTDGIAFNHNAQKWQQ